MLWLSGPTGVGKSSVGWEVFEQLSAASVRAAFVDTDQISLCYPAPEGSTHLVRAGNLAAMVPHFRREGVRCLVLAGFVHDREEVRTYERLLPDAAFTLRRLRAGRAELERRFLARGWRPDLVADSLAEADALDRSDYAEVCVDTDGLGVPEAARLIREGWSHGTSTPTPTHRAAGSVPRAEGEPLPVLWFSGATAAGKSTVGYEVFSAIVRSGVRAAYVDVKQISALREADHRLKAGNLAALWAAYRALGARCLIVSGEADTDDTVRAYAELLPRADVTVCRLHAGPGTLAERVARRGAGGGPALPGDELKGLDQDALRRVAERAAREAQELERAGAGDLRIGTDGRTVAEIAAEVQVRGLPRLAPTTASGG